MRAGFAKAGLGVALALVPGSHRGALAASCVGYSVCPAVNYAKVLKTNTQAKAVLSSIASTQASALTALNSSTVADSLYSALLGRVLVFDANLSASRNEACAMCHTPSAGFADGISAFTAAGGIFPGSVRTRAGNRTPLSLAYASFSPALSLVAGPPGKPALFVGGNFWDMRATGLTSGSPAADQAQAPLTNPLEMALPDPACAVRRISQASYAGKFTALWGSASLAISWPSNTDSVCSTPNNGGSNQTPLALSAADRAQVTVTLADIGASIAAYEGSTLSAAFSSKFDAVQAGSASFTTAEAAGFALFTGQGHCNACHAVHPPPGAGPAGPVLFTDFSARNDGVPHNTADPYLGENVADASGFVANAAGSAYIDEGVGGFLASTANTNTSWKALAGQFDGTFKVPSLRNVAALAAKGGSRTYMHNGYFHDLATIVHFYNTRDVLPACTGTTGVGVTCWPKPEVSANESRIIGNLGLTTTQEAEIVDFLSTLNDGYTGG